MLEAEEAATFKSLPRQDSVTRYDLGVCSENESNVGSVANEAVEPNIGRPHLTHSFNLTFKLFLETNAKRQ